VLRRARETPRPVLEPAGVEVQQQAIDRPDLDEQVVGDDDVGRKAGRRDTGRGLSAAA